jgi:hypothetical protein
MYDLNLVAKSTTEIKEIIEKSAEIEAAQDNKNRHNYLLYEVSAITIVSLLLFIITCIEQLPWFKLKTHTEPEPEPTMSLEPTEEPEHTDMIEDRRSIVIVNTTQETENKQCTTMYQNTGYSMYPRL